MHDYRTQNEDGQATGDTSNVNSTTRENPGERMDKRKAATGKINR
jgi:hypothetical protein